MFFEEIVFFLSHFRSFREKFFPFVKILSIGLSKLHSPCQNGHVAENYPFEEGNSFSLFDLRTLRKKISPSC